MALFSALQGIAPHLDAAMVLNVCEGAGLIVSVRDDTGRRLHYSEEVAARLGVAGSDDTSDALRYFDERGRPLGDDELPHERVRRSGEDVLNAISRIEGPRGSIWVQMSFTALAPGDGGYSVLGIGTDITARRQAEAVLERMATHDGLTGLLNRVGLLTPAGRRFAGARAGGRAFAVAMLDIDHFKTVNDSYGHAAGDAVLTVVAETIREALPPAALAGRWGGEEFLVVLPEAGRDEAIAIAELMRRAIAATVTPVDDIEGVAAVGGDEICVTASIGIAVVSPATPTLEALIARADEALYSAKHAGRDRVAA